MKTLTDRLSRTLLCCAALVLRFAQPRLALPLTRATQGARQAAAVDFDVLQLRSSAVG